MSSSPVNDYKLVSKDFIDALKSIQNAVDSDPDMIFDRERLKVAYQTQATIIRQHFAVLSAMYDAEFPPVTPLNSPATSETNV